MRIGIDVDGVLADFNTPFIERVVKETGKDLFPPRPFEITEWNYPKRYGYTNKDINAVWESIKLDTTFWHSLPPYEDTERFLMGLARFQWKHPNDDIYFITSRPGDQAKTQTELWFYSASQGYLPYPTVLISSEKGLCAEALDLDFYIDDKVENCQDVSVANIGTDVYLLDRPWNQGQWEDYATRIHSLDKFLEALNAHKTI